VGPIGVHLHLKHDQFNYKCIVCFCGGGGNHVPQHCNKS